MGIQKAFLIDGTAFCYRAFYAIRNLRTADGRPTNAVYGFARMNIDGHFPRWGVAAPEAERTAEAILDLFIEGIARRA